MGAGARAQRPKEIENLIGQQVAGLSPAELRDLSWQPTRGGRSPTASEPSPPLNPLRISHSYPSPICDGRGAFGGRYAVLFDSGVGGRPFSVARVYFASEGSSWTNEGQGAVVVFLGRLPRSPHEPPVAYEPDAVLVARARVDRKAFAPLYLRYVEEIARFCFVRLRDEEAARDATQQIFARALAGLSRYRRRANSALGSTPSRATSWQTMLAAGRPHSP